ncbi:helix-turn-helix domain-containing protein [Xylanibacter ruminicola]|nr:helix-turn-helix domain-containing protein [Xylanibacter ruminicola]
MSDEPMTIKEAAEFFKIDVQAMYKRVQRKMVQFHKDGRRLYFFKKELIAGLKAK